MTAPHPAPAIAQLLALYNTAGRVPVMALPRANKLPVLPKDEQAVRGVMYALDTMQTWCAQLLATAHHASNDPEDAKLLTPRTILTERLQFTADLAKAQQLGFYG
ncbi:hypothetical protein [Mameliella alba]|uniref:Uncharacterized protein n=1 Tax=Mameliella alba TaxID=561184 RepID=A0A0B3RGB5_9RHOB|nr:hypothetical protein [Mameliella alba]KHQ50310.1 hypothetical protein OA50_05158 [Mameliella alba]